MALNCDAEVLNLAAKDFLEPATAELERQAIHIFLMIQALTALGGTNFSNLTTLQEATKEWQAFFPTQLSAISLEISRQNAVANGATGAANDINDLKESSRCILCLPQQIKDQIQVYLKCRINALGKPE